MSVYRVTDACVSARARAWVWSLTSFRTAQVPFGFPSLFPLVQVLISQSRDQRRSLAISQREPLIQHRSARGTAARRTWREPPQSSLAPRKEKPRRGSRARDETEACICVFLSGSGRTKLELFLCRGTWNNEARAGFNKARFPRFQPGREADEPAAENDR